MPTSLKTDHNRDEAFERITSLLRDILDVDVAAVSLIEGGRQTFRSIQGLELTEICLEDSFCRATWHQGRSVIIADAAEDGEFQDHPLVTEMNLRSYAGVLLRTSDGGTIGTICAIHGKPRQFSERDLRVMENLAYLASSEFELHEFATRDALTGAFARRQFFHEAQRLCQWAQRQDAGACVIMLDVDHFKSVNDRFGHAAGDDVLRLMVATCKASLRDFDIIGRLGGEEFAVVMVGSPREAVLLAERLRSVISDLSFTFDGETVRITTSFGVAAVLPEEGNLDAALLRADKALYRAKADGRDRVVLDAQPQDTRQKGGRAARAV